jgi:DNA repair protein RadD
MQFEDRKYQTDAVTSLLKSLYYDPHCHPVIAVPTGAGKTVIIGRFVYKYLEWKPRVDVLILSHTETIVYQDYLALKKFFPGINIGLYSSGLGSKTIEKITVAGIQSVYKKPHLFKDVGLVIVDECHTVPSKGNGMYRQLFKEIKATRVGMSATVFRTGTGYVYQGKGALFNKLSFDLSTLDGFNSLVEGGYLTKLLSKPPGMELNTEGLRTSAGDFNLKDMSQKFDRIEITNKAIDELVKFGKNYKSWLVFAINIKHADHIYNELKTRGIPTEVLHSKNKKNGGIAKKKFIQGKARALVSVGMITTGFDAPNVDLIALLRPTKSPVLHVQMIGRGLRVAEGKDHCLVLDFAGNVKRLGPVNSVQVPKKKGKRSKKGDPIVKQCPVCGCLYHPSVKVCLACGHVFTFKENIKAHFGKEEVVAKSKTKWVKVIKVQYDIHKKHNRPDSLKVTYFCGLTTAAEYICYDHEGYAGYKALNWVRHRWNHPKLPADVDQLHKYSSYLTQPIEILIDLSAKYSKILEVKFSDKN